MRESCNEVYASCSVYFLNGTSIISRDKKIVSKHGKPKTPPRHITKVTVNRIPRRGIVFLNAGRVMVHYKKVITRYSYCVGWDRNKTETNDIPCCSVVCGNATYTCIIKIAHEKSVARYSECENIG